ncbi:hypothetical protein AWH62_00990 [Maricaulis sp. W15]|uniref:hypothetical protein n=1 Tax=Maricaulis sp. W15 TaxID=1772333 RepID=UPI00094905AB|nr:hypothetical protein [Maricaulis sp. W15]OLF81282.1 hypothetical protein AWH62_00990 [Maricaulis sp. W15]
MTLDLPADLDIASITPYPITARREQKPVFGGPVSRVKRMGTRWAIAYQLLPHSYLEAMDLTDLEDEDERVSAPIPQPGLDVGNPGDPVVDGAGQTGNSYAVRGLTVGYTIRKGQWMSVIVGGKRFVYRARAAVTADGTGRAVVPVRPMIRSAALDGATVELADPRIEGFVTLPQDAFKVSAPVMVSGLSFTIEETD